MSEEFDTSVDTFSFDDIGTDITDTDSFSDSVDVSSMMDDIPSEPIDSFEAEPVDSGFDTDFSADEICDIDNLMEEASENNFDVDYLAAEMDDLDSSSLIPTDMPSDTEDYEQDAGSDIADLMDEAAIETIEDTVLEPAETEEMTDSDIETLMDDANIETLDVIDTPTNDADAATDSNEDIESLMSETETLAEDRSEGTEDISPDLTDEVPVESSDVSSLMDESDIDTPPSSANEVADELFENTDTEEVVEAETQYIPVEMPSSDSDISDGADNIGTETDDMPTEAEQGILDQEPVDSAVDGSGTNDFAQEGLTDTIPSAHDMMGEYYASHNYGPQDFAEYSKDPEWQELNNALLQESGREPIDYGNDDIPNIDDIRDELIAAGIPEDSPELAAILANEQSGIDAIVEARRNSSPPVDPIDGGTNNPPNEPPIDPIESVVDADVSSVPVHLSQNDVYEFIENSSDKDALQNLREGIQSGEIQIDADDISEGSGSGPVLTRDVSEQWELGNNAIDDNIEAMRDDLRDKGLEDGPKMESIVMAERARMQEELERNIRGDFSDPYQKPDFGELLQEQQVSEELSATGQDIPQELSEETPPATDISEIINYDEVFEGLDNYDFDGINFASDTDRLDSSLDNFNSSTWEGLTLDEQKAAMTDLADYVKDVISFDNPPEIVYYNNPVDGDYGGYSPGSNTLEVNEYMLYNNEEAADTVAHELWHAYQHQRASNPQSAKDYQYQYGFDNYIRPEDDFTGYQDQLVEAEARAFAQQFKDRLNLKGRRI